MIGDTHGVEDAFLKFNKRKKLSDYEAENSVIDHNIEKEPEIKILDMKELIGKPKSEVMNHVMAEYSGQYNIPGARYGEYLLENPDKVPKELKDVNWYHFMGSRVLSGASVFCVFWQDGKLKQADSLLRNNWGEDDRVLLLEK